MHGKWHLFNVAKANRAVVSCGPGNHWRNVGTQIQKGKVGLWRHKLLNIVISIAWSILGNVGCRRLGILLGRLGLSMVGWFSKEGELSVKLVGAEDVMGWTRGEKLLGVLRD